MNNIQNRLSRGICLAGLMCIGSTLSFYTSPVSHTLIGCSAVNAHIINGKTPDDIDESSCSESDLIEYVERAKKVISSKWQPLKGFEDRSATAIFTVEQNGKIDEARIIESSGSQAVDQSALDALKIASPLPPLPKGAPETIQIRYVFSWHVTHNYDRSPSPTPKH